MKEWFLNLFVGKYLGSFIRTAMAGLGGWLLSKGIIDDVSIMDSLAQNFTVISSGVLIYLFAQGSSLVQKKMADTEVEK